MTRDFARRASAIAAGEGRAAAGLDFDKRPEIVIGITGPPGAGKSTVVDALLSQLARTEERIAVLAVDPSSPFTGGALLGDRVRMNTTAPGVFIRSLASRGHGGGLAPAMRGLIALFGNHGFGTLLIETVGIGQQETAIRQLADVTVAVLTPAGGDSVQAEKAGLLEAADVIALNKCDLDGADLAARDLAEATGLPVVRMIARDNVGAAELLAAVRGARGRRTVRELQTRFSIDHLGIAVASLDESLRFYEATLGMRVVVRETVPQEGVHVAMLDAGGSRIELLEPTGEDSPVSRFLIKRGPGLHHVALSVSAFDNTVATLKHSGAKLIAEPRRGAGGHRYVFLHPSSTGGVLLELIGTES